MFSRAHHRRIVALLEKLDADLLRQADCFFGGGTAIVLLANEYRESVDIDFLCASHDGYRLLRELVSDQSLGALFKEPVALARNVRKDRDKIFTALDDGSGLPPIKLELVLEGRIQIAGELDPRLPVAVLAKPDLYAEKILANSDRWADASTLYRDAIDLAMMIDQWGPIPHDAIVKTQAAYGRDAIGALNKVTAKLSDDPAKLTHALQSMGMDAELGPTIMGSLHAELARIHGAPKASLVDPEPPASPDASL